MKRIEGYSGLAKKGLAVVNIDKKAYLKAKERKAEKERIEGLENRLNNIERLLEKLVNAK